MPRTLSEADGWKLAFRCKNCGRLHTSDHAGEAPHPHACEVCGCGVIFSHQKLADLAKAAMEAGDKEKLLGYLEQLKKIQPGHKQLVKDNWEVLAEATPERLKELGLELHQVVKHERWTKPTNTPEREPQHLERAVSEAAVAASKQE